MSAAVHHITPPESPWQPVIKVRFDRIYGKIVCYPVCDKALLVARIARTKTLRPEDLAYSRGMGFRISVDDASHQLLQDFLSGAM